MKVIFVLIIFSIGIISSSCEKTNDNTRLKTTSEPHAGGSIIIGVNGEAETLNPLFSESSVSQEISHLVMLGLADLDENSEFKPELAESWESSPDFLKLTYHLRNDIVWSDGTPITAADVKFTYDLLMDTSVASPRQGVCDFIKTVTVVDPQTVTFEFTEAYPTQVFDTAGEILPKHLLENVAPDELRSHPFGRNPLASGPFKINRWESQQFIELVPNEKYFDGRAYLDKVVFKIIPDKTSLLMQLKSGEIDMVSDVPAAEIQQLSQDNEQLNLYQVDGRVYYYLAYNEKNSLFSDKTIRQALTMGLDRQKIIDALLYGYGRRCLGPLPPMLKWAYNEEVKDFAFDPEQAKRVLKTAGWQDTDGDGILDKNGRSFEFTIITSAGNQLKSDVAIVAQEQLKNIGVKINIETLEWTTMLKKLQSKEFDACVNGWSTPYYVDPTPVFHSTSTNLFNFISYVNPRVDKLIETGRVEMDQAKAAKIWKEFHQVLFDDQPYTFLFWIDKAVVVNSRFKNVTPLALSPVYNLEKWYVTE